MGGGLTRLGVVDEGGRGVNVRVWGIDSAVRQMHLTPIKYSRTEEYFHSAMQVLTLDLVSLHSVFHL